MMAETTLLIAGVYLALAVFETGLTGVMTAYAVAAGASTVILTGGMMVRMAWRFRPDLAWQLMVFGAPLAAAGIALPILHVGDRYIMEWLSSTEEVAIYGWAARLSGILNMLVVQSFQLAFAVVGIKELGSGEEGLALHRRTFRHFCVWAGWAALGLSLIAYDLTALLSSTEAYLAAAPMVFPLSIGLVLFGLYIIATNVLYAEGQTKLVAVSMFAAAALNIGLNVVLIPALGGMGAAVATLITYAALGLGVLRISERYRPAGYRYGVVLVVCIVAAGCWYAGYAGRDLALGMRLMLYAGLLGAYLVLMAATRVYSIREISAGISMLRRGRDVPPPASMS
jgi:O-antigen/teichoic acid export membrane protein